MCIRDRLQRVDDSIKQDRRVNPDKTSENFSFIYHTIIRKTVTTHLNYRIMCAKWIRVVLMTNTRTVWVLRGFLSRYSKDVDEFLRYIVSRGGTWVSYATSECKVSLRNGITLAHYPDTNVQAGSLNS